MARSRGTGGRPTEATAHARSRPRVEAQGTLAVTDGTQPGCFLVAGEVTKAQQLVVGAVPGHLDVCDEGERTKIVDGAPRCSPRNQCPTEALPRVGRGAG